MTPYNTGKVKVGLAHIPRPRYATSRDEEFVQSLLLSKGRRRVSDLFLSVVLAAIAAAIVIIVA